VKPRVDAPFNGGVLFKFKVSIRIPLFEGDIDVITLVSVSKKWSTSFL
jgi:hypothetical protein